MRIVIAGASGGVGKDITNFYAREKNDFHLIYNTNKDGVAELEVDDVTLYKCDMTSEAEVAATFSSLENVDVFINCVGITADSTIVKMSEEQWDSVIDASMKSTFLGCKHVLPKMRPGGSIIIISSAVAKNGAFGACNYAAAKGGVEAFVRSFALEAAKRDVRVNAVGMGFFNTGMGTRLPEKIKESALSRIPLKRFGYWYEMETVIRFLVECGYITGQTVYVDGGLR